MKRLIRYFAAAALALALVPAHSQKTDFPTRGITLVAATTPGGALDIVARVLAPALEREFKQPVVVENRPGAGAQVGAAHVAKAPPDGHTLLISTGVALAPVFTRNPPVRLDDLAPVSLIAEGPLLMVVPKDVPVNSMSELFAHVRAHPGKLNHASVGRGSAIALYFEWWKAKEDLKMQEIAFQGPGPIQAALLRNDVQMALFGVATSKAYIDTGKGKALAITGQKRLPLFPGVPTFEESGVPGISGTMVGLHAPAGTPPAVIERIHAVLQKVGQSPEFSKRMEQLNFVVELSTPEELGQREAAAAKWALEVARVANIKPD